MTYPKWMSINNSFSEVMADVLSSWHDVDKYLSAPEHKTAKHPAFIDIVTLHDDLVNFISKA